jgi:hypothetical protein
MAEGVAMPEGVAMSEGAAMAGSSAGTGRGWRARVDGFLVGPGATRGERAVCFATAVVGTALALAAGHSAWGAAVVPLIVVGAAAFDLFGGAAANTTDAARRQWHGPGRTAWHHAGFVAAHVHPFVFAWLLPGFGWDTAALLYGLVLASAAAVLLSPPRLRRPVAFATAALALTAVTFVAPVPAPLAWIAPVMLLKLVPGHLLADGATPPLAPPAPGPVPPTAHPA